MPLANEIGQESPQPLHLGGGKQSPLHLGGGKQSSFRQTEVPQAVEVTTDVVEVEVRVSLDFLRDLFIELLVAVLSDTLSGTF